MFQKKFELLSLCFVGPNQIPPKRSHQISLSLLKRLRTAKKFQGRASAGCAGTRICPVSWDFFFLGEFLRGGVRKGGGFHTPVRGTMFVCNGAVTPGPSRECDITFFVRGQPKSARQSRDSTVAARRVQSVTVPSSRVSRECRSPGLRSPL